MKSLRDSEKSHLPPTVLEMTIVGSVVIAFLCMMIWFFTLAGSPLSGG
ncbi:MAG: hypothetical protein ACSLFD_07885 [Solirubrobacterales bacterium]